MILEIAGLVGSGKSALASSLMRRVPSIRAGWSLRHVSYTPLVVRSLARVLLSNRWYPLLRVKRRAYALKALLHLDIQLDVLAAARREGSDEGQVVLFDEGLLFKLCWLSLLAQEGDHWDEDWERWFQATIHRIGSIVDTVIWLEAPNEVLVPRIRARPLQSAYGLRSQEIGEAHRLLDHFRSLYQLILASMPSQEAPVVLRFSTTSQSSEIIATEVINQLALGGLEVPFSDGAASS